MNALGQANALIHPHPTYQRLGDSREERCAAYYRPIAFETLSDEDIEAIRLNLQRQHARDPTASAPPSRLNSLDR